MDDERLISLAQGGNLDAFNALVLRYQDTVYNHACRMLGDFDAAEDVTQETFIRAFRKSSQFRGGSYRAWLLRIASNLCYDHMRAWKRHPNVSLEPVDDYGEEIESPYWIQDPGPQPEEEAQSRDFHRTLQSALNALPAQYRAAVTLIDIQEMQHDEAAAIMGVPIGTVKSRVARGRGMLRDMLVPSRDGLPGLERVAA